MAQIKISSFNVRGINGETKRRDVLDYLKQSQNNIICLQDIHCGHNQEDIYKSNWEGEMIIASGTSNSRGVAILIEKNFEYTILETKIDPGGNYTALKVRMLDTDISLINIYGPNIDNPGFYDEIQQILDDFQTASIIMCGDWNLVQNQDLDTQNYIRENNTRSRIKVESLKKQYELVDPWRINYPTKKQYTWFQLNPIKMSRLDFFLVSSDIMSLTTKTNIIPGYRSDHSITIIQLKVVEETRGRGFWKFNTSLLQDQKYSELIKQIIAENIERYAMSEENHADPNVKFCISDQLFFETLKMEIRKSTIYYSSKKKKEKERQENYIIKKIELLENNPDINQNNINEISNLKGELEILRRDKIKGIILRSKIQWLEEGEKPTQFFATLEKRNYVNKLINKLNINGNIIQNQSSILHETKVFYQNLYKSKMNQKEENNIDIFLEDQIITKLSEEQKQSCELTVNNQEIKDAIKHMKNDKTPGIDGIPIDFYKFFWVDLGHFLIRSIQGAFEVGELSITQKRGIITCIPKGDKPREYLKNWRPITLLTADYKLLTTVMANRMKKVLNKIISSDQRGFLKDRYMEENTRLIYDLIQYCKENNREGILLLIDFEKAFDSIEWKYIKKILRKYNFGKNFIRWFNIVYNNSQSSVINNGNYSEFLNLGRGCRQGDPWSTYLFILAIEPLAQAIKHNHEITGIQIGNKEIKLGQYADDTFLTLSNSETTISSAVHCIKDFKLISGLAINVEKTQVIKLGEHNSDINCPILNIPYIDKFNLLGIHFSTNLQEMDKLNFKYKISQIKKTIKFYQWRNLSLAGRITIVKMYLLPKLVHLLAVLPTPKQTIMKEINTIFSQFIWNNKRPKIQFNALVQDYKYGGQKMIHLESFCKATKLTWVQKIYKSSDDNSWKIMAREILKERHIAFIFEGTIPQLKIKANKIKNIFWKEILHTWSFYRDKIDTHTPNDQWPHTVIWNSGIIKNPNLLTRRNEFMQKGLIYFKDLYKFNTN